MALRDTLHRQKQEADAEQQALEARPQVIAEWQGAIRELFQAMRGWLAQHETDGLLSFGERQEPRNEESLGDYQVPVMTITAGNKTISVKPSALRIVGGYGKVDMHVGAHAPAASTVSFVRGSAPGSGESQWLILNPPEVAQNRRPVQQRVARPRVVTVPLTSESFEQMLDYLLRGAR